MSEISVKIDKIASIADLLEKQADELESAGNAIDSIRNNLQIDGSSRARIMSAMKSSSNDVRNQSRNVMKMGQALREIAAEYRRTENRILGNWQSSGINNPGTGNDGTSNGSNGTQKGKNKKSGKYSADPVNLNTGNFILENQDMEIPGFSPLILERYYNSMGEFSGMLGKDWNTGFELKICLQPDHTITGSDISVILGDGRTEYFSSTDGKYFIPILGSTAELIPTEEGYCYRTLEGENYLFDKEGRYVRFEDAHLVGYDLSYDGSLLKRVEKDSGEFYAFYYGADGLLETAEDHTGRKCQYFFKDGHLTEVVCPDGGSFKYTYNQAGKISRVCNPRSVNAVETEYDNLHRVTFQKFADGTTNIFEYKDAEQAVIMTERDGSVSVHYHDSRYQNVKNIYADGEETFEYNDRGQKIMVKDKLGNVTRLQYDNRGNVTGIITPDKVKYAATYDHGNRLVTMSVNGKSKVHNQYNSFGDLICTEDGLGRQTHYRYDDQGHVIAVVLADQSEVIAQYDARGNISAVKNADGAVIVYDYDALNRMVRQIDAKGNTTTYDYDVIGRITAETRADGSTKEIGYDKAGNTVFLKEFDGSVTTGVYNENNKLVEETDPTGRKLRFEYDAMWNISKVILPNGGVFKYLYNKNNRLEMTVDAEGNEIHYQYDAMGNLLKQTYPEGISVNYSWDAAGRCTQITMPDGAKTEVGYNEEDKITYVKDAEGIELFKTYDAAGQLIAENDSLGRSRRYEYSSIGNLLSILDERGQKTSYVYADGTDKIIEKIYADGTKEYFTYDLNGNIESHTDIYGQTLYYQYDVLDRIIAMRKSTGAVSEYVYDPMGRILCETDFAGNKTAYTYTVTGQLESVTDALGNVTNYSYDASDELIGILRKLPGTEEAVKILYERNLMGQLTSVTDPLGNTETYRYDGFGRMVEKTDKDQLLTKYAYNAAGLLSQIQWADGKEVSYEYTPTHHISQVHDWTGDTKFEYEGGYLTQVIYPDNRSLVYNYDKRGNRTKMCYPDGREISYEYDEWNRLLKTVQDGYSSSYSYNEKGDLITRTASNGNKIQYQYDAQGLLSKLTHTDSQGVLDEFSMGYDVLGRRNRYEVFRRDFTQDNGLYEYEYDSAGHLASVMKDQQMLRSYTYDSLGNRSSMVNVDPLTRMSEKTEYQYDRRGGLKKAISSRLTEEYQYDRRGNLIQLTKNGKLDRNYQYDAMNRLIQAKASDGNQATYEYNGLGYRTGMHTVQGGKERTVRFTQEYDKLYNNLLEMADNNGTESYIWGVGLDGFVTGTGSAGWFMTDSLGSVLRKTNEKDSLFVGNYDEFGNVSTKAETTDSLFGYNGFQFDPVAGTWFAQARQYRSQTGTFDGMDRFGGDITMPETLNPYVYCMYDPFTHTDKSGYWFGIDDAIAAGIGAVGGIAGTFIGDVVDYAVTGEWDPSSWQEYTGAAIGGAAGGVSSLYVGPIAAGAVSGGVTRLATEGLTYASDPSGYEKSGWDVLKETAVDTGLGALGGAVSKLSGKAMKKLAGSKAGKWVVSKLNKGGKITQFIANKISDIANGKSSKQWSQLTKHLKKQHKLIGSSDKMKNKLYSLMLKALPVYVGQEILSKITKKVKPVDVIWSKTKKELSKWLKDILGINDDDGELCVSQAGGAGGGGGR